jgi:hypothetical protein
VTLLILTLDTRATCSRSSRCPETRRRGTRGRGGRTTSVRGFVRDQAYRLPGSTTAGPSPPKGRAPARTSWCNGQVVVGQHVAEKLGIPAVLALPIPMYVPTREFPLGAEPGHFLAGEGPGDDVRPHRRQVARRWTCRDAVAGMIRAARPADWPDAATVTGCWFLADTEREQSPLP